MLLIRGALARFMYRVFSQLGWREILLFVIFHCFTAWLLHLWAEPDAEYVRPDTFWYYYFITATTIGYGDFSAGNLVSRLLTVFYIGIPGIALIGVVIGKIGAVFIDMADKVRRGLMQLHFSGHTIVVGDGTPHTLTLLRNLVCDSSVGEVVLVSTRQENPMNGTIAGFVSGDIDDEATQQKACFTDARCVIVLGETDTEVTGRTITVMDCSGKDTQIVSYLRHESSAKRLHAQTDARVTAVASVSMDMVVQEALDPGAANFVAELLQNNHGGTYLSLTIPEGIDTTWVELGYRLMLQDVNPMTLYEGDDPDVIPKATAPVRTGDVIAVAAANRDQLDTLDWSSLRAT